MNSPEYYQNSGSAKIRTRESLYDKVVMNCLRSIIQPLSSFKLGHIEMNSKQDQSCIHCDQIDVPRLVCA